jgi:hypothetical protein
MLTQTGGASCAGMVSSTEMQAFVARATAPDLLAALSGNSCPGTADETVQVQVSLTDGKTFGPANAFCPGDGGPIGGLRDAASQLFTKYCESSASNNDASTNGD